MRIAIMSNTDKGLKAKVSNHFGRAKYLNIVESDNYNSIETILNHNHNFGGKLSPPKFIHDQKIDVLLAKNLGENAFDSLRRFGVKVMLGANGTIEETIEAFRENKLRVAKAGDKDIHPMNYLKE